jgi:DNA-binding PadR family transcriptional regulator
LDGGFQVEGSSLLYSFERNELIEGTWIERKRVYKLTDKGSKTIGTILNSQDKIKGFMSTIPKAKTVC